MTFLFFNLEAIFDFDERQHQNVFEIKLVPQFNAKLGGQNQIFYIL